MRVAQRVDGGDRGFADGLLVRLVEAIRAVGDGEIVELVSRREDVDAGLRSWSTLTGHAIVSVERAADHFLWRVRKGAPKGQEDAEPARAIGSRLWLYSNFDCNLRCDYCCVRSSPETERRALGLSTIERLAREARELGGVDTIYVTGGEPFALPDIQPILEACLTAAPTTLLTNGTLFLGPRLATLEALPREGLTIQISIDSPTPELHDLHRGAGTFRRAWRGVVTARERGFRVRLAATVSTDAEEAALDAFFEGEGIPAEDRVIRRVALRGLAEDGVALSLSDLVPEVTFTARGVFWHPVGADDDDFLVRSDHFPLAESIDAVRRRWEEERALFGSLAQIFHCA